MVVDQVWMLNLTVNHVVDDPDQWLAVSGEVADVRLLPVVGTAQACSVSGDMASSLARPLDVPQVVQNDVVDLAVKRPARDMRIRGGEVHPAKFAVGRPLRHQSWSIFVVGIRTPDLAASSRERDVGPATVSNASGFGDIVQFSDNVSGVIG